MFSDGTLLTEVLEIAGQAGNDINGQAGNDI
jgi:hypothetical protein